MNATPQEKMKAKLQAAGIPYRTINVYGLQIVVTTISRDTADRWASLLGKFAKVSRILESVDYTKENRGTMLVPTSIRVWRTYATV